MVEVQTLAPDPGIDAPPVAITLLGPPHVSVDGQPLVLQRRQARGLLFRIAAAAQPVPRDQLSFLFWPDAPDESARRNLTVLLSQLRQTLPPGILRTDSAGISLDPALVAVDVITAKSLAAAGLRDGRVEQLAAAAEQYRGPFLDGFSLPEAEEYEGWLAQERQVWERWHLELLSAVVEGHAAAGAYPAAITAARRALASDPLAEELHRRLIELYGLIGDRGAAARQFEQCVVILERELGVEPLTATRAAYEAVRDGQAMPAARPAPHSAARAALGAPQRADSTASSEDARGRASALPAPPTPLIGRQFELATLTRLLADPRVRLLTLTGTGGSGKTRLALEVARGAAEQFADGVVLVALAALRDPALLLDAIAQGCGFGQRTPAGLAEQLRDKQLLLVLDNCEHLAAAAPDIAALLAAAPNLRILVTSRTPLRIQGEHTAAVPPLPLPDLANLPPPDVLATVPAVALLLARARAQLPHLQLSTENAADLAAICVRLDGLPLALELAATRLSMLSPRDLLRRLDHRLAVLTKGARDLPARQQTLRATIEWSYRLLRFEEQRCFERCSSFAGGWTLEAAETLDRQLRGVATAGPTGQPASQELLDLLETLVEHSLVHVELDAEGEPRFSMLETIREFAAERLRERGDALTVGQAHAELFGTFIEQLEQSGVRTNTPQWVATIERDHDNLRTALRFVLDHNLGEQALHLGSQLHRFWYFRDYEREGRRWLDEILARTTQIRSMERAQLLGRAGMMAAAQGELARAIELYEQALELCAKFPVARLHATLRNALAIPLCRRGEYVRAIALIEEALLLARQLGDPDTIVVIMATLPQVFADRGQELDRAVALHEEALAAARAIGKLLSEANVQCSLANLLAHMGEYERAEQLASAALRLQQEIKADGAMIWTRQILGLIASLQADYIGAREQFLASLAAATQLDRRNAIPATLDGLACVAVGLGRPAAAARLLGAAEALRERTQNRRPPLEQPAYQRTLAAVRARLTESALRTAWEAGRTLPLAALAAELQAIPTPVARPGHAERHGS